MRMGECRADGQRRQLAVYFPRMLGSPAHWRNAAALCCFSLQRRTPVWIGERWGVRLCGSGQEIQRPCRLLGRGGCSVSTKTEAVDGGRMVHF